MRRKPVSEKLSRASGVAMDGRMPLPSSERLATASSTESRSSSPSTPSSGHLHPLRRPAHVHRPDSVVVLEAAVRHGRVTDLPTYL